MKSIILYALAPNSGFAGPYWTVYTTGHDIKIPVRAEVVEGNVLDALALATPQPEEIVLNTIPFEG